MKYKFHATAIAAARSRLYALNGTSTAFRLAFAYLYWCACTVLVTPIGADSRLRGATSAQALSASSTDGSASTYICTCSSRPMLTREKLW